MRFICFLFIYIFYAVVPTEAKEVILFVEMNACDIKLIAMQDEKALKYFTRKDLCRVATEIRKATGHRAKGVVVYFIPFSPWPLVIEPSLNATYQARGIRPQELFFSGFVGYHFGDGIIQVSPNIFIEDADFSQLSNYLMEHSGTLKQDLRIWYGMVILAHEILHHTLENIGVPTTTQHCVMVYPPHQYLLNIERSLARKYRVDEKFVKGYSALDTLQYTAQCAKLRYTIR